jgi:hypothetical protein
MDIPGERRLEMTGSGHILADALQQQETALIRCVASQKRGFWIACSHPSSLSRFRGDVFSSFPIFPINKAGSHE